MKRTEKIVLLTQALQGKTVKLQALKQAQEEETIVFVFDEAPEGWYGNPDDERSVKVNYQLGNEDVTEYLTKGQMQAKTKGVIFILSHNGRSGRLVEQFANCPPPKGE